MSAGTYGLNLNNKLDVPVDNGPLGDWYVYRRFPISAGAGPSGSLGLMAEIAWFTLFSGRLTPSEAPTPLSQGEFRLVVRRGYSWDATWELASNLLVDIETSEEGVVATTFLEVAEYGIGASLNDAVLDLLTSLSDYLVSLEERADRLSPEALQDLQKLRGLVRAKDHG